MKVAVYGKFRSGKSEVCSIISNSIECDLFDFGDALKECVAIVYPKSVNKPKDRGRLIKFGQHLRKLDENIWVNIVEHKILNTKSRNILVTGVRQQNEYEMLKDQGFIFIRVDANEDIRIERCIANGDYFNKEYMYNSTETELEQFVPDYIVKNENDLKELEFNIKNILSEIISNQLEKDILKEAQGVTR